MNTNEWLNQTLPELVGKLEKSINNKFDDHVHDGLDLAGRTAIYEVLDDLLAILFPDAYNKEKVVKSDINFFLNDRLRHISFKLSNQITNVFKYRCLRQNCDHLKCEERADGAFRHLIASLPEIREILMQDIQAAFDGDPAAKSVDEVVLSYPYVEAIATHRIAHLLYELDVPIIPRIMSERAHSRTGIDIHPGAQIKPRFFIDHGTGVVIGETATIGTNVKLFQGVTLGALSFALDKDGKPIKDAKRHPDIEDDVVIYANATILGGTTVIGKGSIIGGNTWITKSVPPNSRVYNEHKQKKLRLIDGDGI